MPDLDKVYNNRSTWKSIFTLALPALVTILVMLVYNMADLFFISRLGDNRLIAAVSMVSPVFSLLMSTASMIGMGGSAYIARTLGSKELKDAGAQGGLCFYATLVVGAILLVLILGLRGPILVLLGTPEAVRPYAMSYLTVLGLGVPFMMFPSSLANLVRTEGAVKESMIGNMLGTVTNIVLDPIFILVFHWGVTGAAIATVIGNILSSAFYLHYLTRRTRIYSLNLSAALAQLPVLPQILLLGVPTAVNSLLGGLASTIANRFLASYGTDTIAAMSSAGKISMLVSMLQIGVCMGIQPLFSYHYGAKNEAKLKDVIVKLTLLSVVGGVGLTALCFIFRGAAVRLFLTDDATAALAEQFLFYLMAGAPFLGITFIAQNFLQGAGKAGAAILLSILRQGLFYIPSLFVMNALLGETGVAAAHLVTDYGAILVSIILFVWHYRKFQKECAEAPKAQPA